MNQKHNNIILIIGVISILLLYYCQGVTGIRTSSCYNITNVCSGDQLELTCSTTGRIHEWSFSWIANTRALTSIPINDQSYLIDNVNSVILNFTRITAQNTLPLVSRLLIIPVVDALNGTSVNCTGVETLQTQSTMIVVISNEDLTWQNNDIITVVTSEVFESSNVTVTLEWTRVNSLYTYHVIIVPQVEQKHNGSTQVQFTALYNTQYNVSVVAEHPCGQHNMTTSKELYYAKCGNPATESEFDDSILIIGYSEPALEESTISLSCPSGQVVTGPNTSMCVDNGKWEPDPTQAGCGEPKAICADPEDLITDDFVTIVDNVDPAVVGSTISFTCPPELALTGPNSSVCMDTKVWEPDPKIVMCKGSLDSAPIAVIVGSVVGFSGFITTSVGTVIIVLVLVKTVRRKGLLRLYKSYEDHKIGENTESLSDDKFPSDGDQDEQNVAARGLVYAEIIGQSNLTQNQQARLIAIELRDEPIQYSQVNHALLTHKCASELSIGQANEESKTKGDDFDDSNVVNLDTLLIQLRSHVSSRWFHFGEAVGIPIEVLEKCCTDCNPEDCIVEVFDYWLRCSKEQLTWRDVAKVLKVINLHKLALDIEMVYTTGRLPVVVDNSWSQPLQNVKPEYVTTEAPPPIPIKTFSLNSASNSDTYLHYDEEPSQQNQFILNQKLKSEEMLAPKLPPKPVKRCSAVPDIPPRPPKRL